MSADKINVITLGCSKNTYDSEVLMGQIKASGKEVTHEGDGNIVVVNTCGFIDNAKEESIQTIIDQIDLKKQGKIDKLIVSGCLVERYKSDLQKELPEVDHFFGTTHIPEILSSIEIDYRKELVGERLLTTPKGYSYFKISEGCDRVCSFCAIPLMRGKHKSQSIEVLVQNAKKLAAQGVKELILIAQDLTFYGIDLYGKRKLDELLIRLSEVDGIEWIRLHYAFPSGFPKEVLKVIRENEKVCNYLDMPLQHVSSRLLTSMKRGLNKQKTIDLLDHIRQEVPSITLRTTLICGYPTETLQEHEELIDFVETQKFDRLGCFTYSHEENTSAYILDDNIPEEEKQRRVEAVMEAQEPISFEKNLSKVGGTFKCMVDRVEGDYYIARTEFDSPEVDNEVLISTENTFLRIGDFTKITIEKADAFDLYGRVGVKRIHEN